MSLDRIRGTTKTNRGRTISRQEPAEPAALNRGERALPARLPAKWARDSAGRECILPMFTTHATPCRTFYCAGCEVASARCSRAAQCRRWQRGSAAVQRRRGLSDAGRCSGLAERAEVGLVGGTAQGPRDLRAAEHCQNAGHDPDQRAQLAYAADRFGGGGGDAFGWSGCAAVDDLP